MKRGILMFALAFIVQSALAQSFCDGLFPTMIRIPNCSGVVRGEICAFNEMAKHYEFKDTIKYECIDNKIVCSYKGDVLQDWKYDPKFCGKKLMLKYGRFGSLGQGFLILASIPIKNGQSQIYEVIQPKKEKGRIIFKEYKEEGVLPCGEYLEKNCDGKILVKGKYKLENKPSTYTYNWYDDEKKEHTVQNIDNNKTSVRKGTWKYYDEKGTLLFEENYKKNKFKSGWPLKELCSDFDKNLKWNYYKTGEIISPATDLFNAIHAKLGIKKHISLDVTHRGIIYYLNGNLIPSPFFDMKGKYKKWDYQMRNNNNNLLLEYSKGKWLNAYIPDKDGTGEILKFKNKTYSSAPILDIFQTLNFHPHGKYERRRCDGQLLFDGHYMTKDTVYTFREKKLDYDSYEMKWVETTMDHLTSRSGKWKYYDESGATVLEENYPGTMKWTLSADYLCSTLMDEARAMTKGLHNPFMVFNAMCEQLSINSWIREDDILDRKQYYYNGAVLANPEDISKKNHVGDFKFEIPHSSLSLYANTRTQGATGSRKIKRRLNYGVSFSDHDGKERKLFFSRNKLRREERKDGLRNGLYEEKQCNGGWLVKGQYCQIDSFYRDTVVTINTETYEEVIQITENNKAEKKHGIWQYYDAQGILVKEEDYGNCN